MVIRLRGVTQHNLSNIDLDIPLGKMIGLCGVSGSGKSSLAFHVIHAEGQRRYVETFSPYVRQFLERLAAPSAESIENIPPTIALESGTTVKNARSTVGTLTDLNDYLKLLYSMDTSSNSNPLVEAYCPNCQVPIRSETVESILSWIRSLRRGERFLILAPLNMGSFDPKELIYRGFVRIYVEGRQIHLEEEPIPNNFTSPVSVVVDRLVHTANEEARITEALRVAIDLGNGTVELVFSDGTTQLFHTKKCCPKCGFNVPDKRPELFSFNSPIGACPECKGFGRIIGVNPNLVVPDRTLSLSEGAIKPWPPGSYEYKDLMKFCWREGIPTDVPYEKLPQDAKDKIFNGTDDFYGVKGFFEWLEEKRYKVHVRVFLSRYRAFIPCPVCHGTRYRKEAEIFRLLGVPIYELQSWSIGRCLDFFEKHRNLLSFTKSSAILTEEIIRRLELLVLLRLGYLSLDRPSRTLSGGEVQRVHLVRVLGSGLSNVLYIIDEPSTGLHSQDLEHLVKALRRFVEQGNTVLVVDHDPEILRACDELIELGPGGGRKGGKIIARGTPKELALNPHSITGPYLRRGDVASFKVSQTEEVTISPNAIVVKEAQVHNLKTISATFPLGRLIGVSGVSGAGKTTLVRTVLYSSWLRHRGLPVDDEIPPGNWKVEGLQLVNQMMFVDHRPLTRTPRANLLTYSGIMSTVRSIFANTEEAREKGYGPGFFSFNQPGGRCEVCQGEGYEHHEMQFLADVYSECPACRGKRFKEEALKIRYRGWNIADFLDATAHDLVTHFNDHPSIVKALQPFFLLRLDHLKLGQPLATLSAGESQRLKLVPFIHDVLKKEGNSVDRGHHFFFILDEPSKGLHLRDLENLLEVLKLITGKGHTVVIVEHNISLLLRCDWIIDLGPGSGEEGGRLIYEGPPLGLIKCQESVTGRVIRGVLETSSVSEPPRLLGCSQGSPSREILMKGVRHHTLNIDEARLPLGSMIAITGLSGSGKSSLAFDVLFIEGQRRYLECLSNYVRNYFPLPERPTVDLLEGLPPTVAVEQPLSRLGNKSTVGTVTEIYHFLRVLFARAGEQYCPKCEQLVESLTEDEVIERVERALRRSNPPSVLVQVVFRRKGLYRDLAQRLNRMGFNDLRVNGKWIKASEFASSGGPLSRFSDHTIECRLPLSAPIGKEGIELLRKALRISNGLLILVHKDGREEILSLHFNCPRCGRSFVPLEPRLFSFNSSYGACPECGGAGLDEDGQKCIACKGSRLNEQARSVKWASRAIHEWTALTVEESLDFWDQLGERLKVGDFSRWRDVLKPIRAEILTRLRFLMDVGLGYLTLDRSGDTLSGGEVQRIRLAAHLGSNLCGVFYILDEPTVGLHPSDNEKLLLCLKKLRDRGNTVLIVEHDLDTLRASDMVIEMGPGAGRNGGRIVFQGSFDKLVRRDGTLTKKFFGTVEPFEELESRRQLVGSHKDWLSIKSISIRNFHNVDVSIPLKTLTCITGVSGSGKSTLLFDVIKVGLEKILLKGRSALKDLPFSSIDGYEGISRVKEVDHQPIGRTSRSIPATYIGIWDEIRRIFASLPEAKALGFTPSHFSFNLEVGRCEFCKGQGIIVEKMGFLPDVTRTCPSCSGARFIPEVLLVHYKGYSIADVLSMTFDEAGELFKAYGFVSKPIELVKKLGLGYLILGQSSSTLSGGEAQRIKLVKELQKQSRPTIFMLDEPTTGLHRADVLKLLSVLRELVDLGHTVLVIEHNMDFIRLSDYVIDIGPGSGSNGGRIVACGTPEEMKAFVDVSRTARWLYLC
ncbi:MAG: excinuclease ABC subunit UvrA [Syntrophobacterales bacterium]|nr:excinuclease ABC subunit UvrA [Syntrophobacterales bacterium]